MEKLVWVKGARNKLIAVIFNKNKRVWKPYILLNQPDWVIEIINREVIEWFRPPIVFGKEILRVTEFNPEFEFWNNEKNSGNWW